jgi:hypothetical protein
LASSGSAGTSTSTSSSSEEGVGLGGGSLLGSLRLLPRALFGFAGALGGTLGVAALALVSGVVEAALNRICIWRFSHPFGRIVRPRPA